MQEQEARAQAAEVALYSLRKEVRHHFIIFSNKAQLLAHSGCPDSRLEGLIPCVCDPGVHVRAAAKFTISHSRLVQVCTGCLDERALHTAGAAAFGCQSRWRHQAGRPVRGAQQAGASVGGAVGGHGVDAGHATR